MSERPFDVVTEALRTWKHPERSPTANGRWVGSVLEESVRDHLKETMGKYIHKIANPTEYPDISVKDSQGNLYAFEVKATERDGHVNNRTKSPESISKNYPLFREHWVIAILYKLNHETKLFSNIEVVIVELWRYTSASFKDYSALAALGSFDYILRKKETGLAFRSEKEFLDFVDYMSKHAGPIIERNKLAKAWLQKYRQSSDGLTKLIPSEDR